MLVLSTRVSSHSKEQHHQAWIFGCLRTEPSILSLVSLKIMAEFSQVITLDSPFASEGVWILQWLNDRKKKLHQQWLSESIQREKACFQKPPQPVPQHGPYGLPASWAWQWPCEGYYRQGHFWDHEIFLVVEDTSSLHIHAFHCGLMDRKDTWLPRSHIACLGFLLKDW